MAGEQERRKHRRLPIRTDILCKKIGDEYIHNFKANSLNISTAGLLAEMAHYAEINAGDLYNLELEVPLEDNADLANGKMWAYGKVIRVEQSEQRTGRKQIAFEFCTRPRFEI